MNDNQLPNAALKFMRTLSGLLLSVLDAGYHDDIEMVTGYVDTIHRLVGAHLSYRGYTVPTHTGTHAHNTTDDVMDAVGDYLSAVGMNETEAERAIVDAINQVTYEMCEELDWSLETRLSGRR